MNFKIVFTDVDGVLVHDESIDHHSERTIFDGRELLYYPRDLFSLMSDIREKTKLALVTGRPLKRLKPLLPIIPHDIVLVENGNVVLNDKGEIDRDWHEKFQPVTGKFDESGIRDESAPLWELEKILRDTGFHTENEGEVAAFRVRQRNNPHMKICIPDELSRSLQAKGIKMIHNEDSVSFQPANGGKEKGMEYICQRESVSLAETIGIGDDENDIRMLEKVGYPMAITVVQQIKKERNELVRSCVSARGGYVSPHTLSRGTRDLLAKVMDIISR